MKISFNNLRLDKIIFYSLAASLGIIFVNTVYLLVLYNKLPPLIPLFNQLPWGVARLGNKQDIFLPLIIAFLSVVGNTVIALFLYEKIPLLSRILTVTSFLVTTFTFLFIVRITLLVI